MDYELVSLRQITVEYKVPKRTVHSWVQNGRLAPVRVGRSGSASTATLVRKEEALRLVEQWAVGLEARATRARGVAERLDRIVEERRTYTT